LIRVDEDGRTSNRRVYAGGDNSHGPDLVVTALAAGRSAAEAVLATPPGPSRRHGAVPQAPAPERLQAPA